MKKLAKTIAALMGAGSGVLVLASTVFGQNTINITNDLNGTLPAFGPASIVTWIIRLLIVVAFVLAFIMLLIGGIRWILAGGEEKSIASARGQVTGALIGLVIVLSAFAIIKLIEMFFGVNIISGTLSIPSIGTT